MSDRNGWIKIHRKILDNPIVCKDPDHLAVWLYLLLEATHKDHETLYGGKPIVLKPGQLISGRMKISRETKVEQHKVDRILKLFKNAQLIEQRSERYGSIISILNWNKYQDIEQQNEQRVSNERATSEQRVSTKQEIKNGKKGKNIESDVPEELMEPFMEWAKMRAKINKPILSKSTVTRALNSLYKLSKRTETQIAIINQSTDHCWQSFYELKVENKPKAYREFEKEPERKAEPMPENMRETFQKLSGMFSAD